MFVEFNIVCDSYPHRSDSSKMAPRIRACVIVYWACAGRYLLAVWERMKHNWSL